MAKYKYKDREWNRGINADWRATGEWNVDRITKNK